MTGINMFMTGINKFLKKINLMNWWSQNAVGPIWVTPHQRHSQICFWNQRVNDWI